MFYILFSFVVIESLQKTASSAQSSIDTCDNPSSAAFQRVQELRKATMAELQTRWKCTLHSKNKDAFCWQSDDGICYELTFNHLGFWAIEIVCLLCTIRLGSICTNKIFRTKVEQLLTESLKTYYSTMPDHALVRELPRHLPIVPSLPKLPKRASRILVGLMALPLLLPLLHTQPTLCIPRFPPRSRHRWVLTIHNIPNPRHHFMPHQLHTQHQVVTKEVHRITLILLLGANILTATRNEIGMV